MSAPPLSLPEFATIAHHLTVAKQYATASWVLALYEYVITFDREIQIIWQRQFSFATVLWVFNRYTLLLSYCPIILAFFLPFTKEVCLTYVKFPAGVAIVFNVSAGLTLMLRTYALYGRALWVLVLIIPFFFAELALEIWVTIGGTALELPDGLVGCILTGKPNSGDQFAAIWIAQLITPTIIFLLTVVRAVNLRRHGAIRGGIIGLMLRDGVMYFAVIFIVNLANVLQYAIAPPDIRAINGSFAELTTAMMLCRLMLNMRGKPAEDLPGTTFTGARFRHADTYIGNFGEELDLDNVENRPEQTITTIGRSRERQWGTTSLRFQSTYYDDHELDTIYSPRELEFAQRQLRELERR